MNSIVIKLKKLPLAIAIGSIAFGTVLSAEEQEKANSLALEEVIVTATKRAESVQDIPISVGVVTGELISDFDVKDVGDLQSFVPGFQVQKTFGSWAVRVRGIGSGITNLAFDSSVPVYLDGVYCGRGKCMEGALMDIERVEVARGPQGALFGKSTIAGALSIISAKPTDEFEGYVKAGYETVDGGYTLNGMVSGALSDTVRGRVAVKTEDLDGWTKNTYTGKDDGGVKSSAVRASLAWDASDTMEFNLKLETGSTDSEGRNNQPVSGGLFGLITTDSGMEYVADDVRRASANFGGTEDYAEHDWTLVTLTMDKDIGEHTLTAIASHWDYDSEWYLDVDGIPEFALNTQLADDYKQNSFELRLLSPTNQTFEYIVGAWYQNSDLTTHQSSPFAPAFWQVALPPFLHGLIHADPTGMSRNFERQTDAFSVYGQLTWNASDRLRTIFDLRYTEEDQDALGYAFGVTWPNSNSLTPSRWVGSGLFGHDPEYRFNQNRKDDSLDPSVRIQYDATDDVVVYAGYSKGSKAGGMKANDSKLGVQLLAADPTLTPADIIGITLTQGNGVFDFEDEEAESMEFGVKSTLLDGAATLNFALFTMDFTNLQTSNYDGDAFIIGNAGAAEIQGLELEGSWQASENLRLNASFSYVDAVYSDFAGAQCVVGVDNLPVNDDCVGTGTAARENQAGEKLERSPDVEYNINAMWESELTDSTLFRANLSMYHSGDYFVQPTHATYSIQDAFTKWDIRLSIAGNDDTWEIALNGRNLTNEMVIQHAYSIAGSNFNSLSRGRSLTLEGTYRF